MTTCEPQWDRGPVAADAPWALIVQVPPNPGPGASWLSKEKDRRTERWSRPGRVSGEKPHAKKMAPALNPVSPLSRLCEPSSLAATLRLSGKRPPFFLSLIARDAHWPPESRILMGGLAGRLDSPPLPSGKAGPPQAQGFEHRATHGLFPLVCSALQAGAKTEPASGWCANHAGTCPVGAAFGTCRSLFILKGPIATLSLPPEDGPPPLPSHPGTRVAKLFSLTTFCYRTPRRRLPPCFPLQQSGSLGCINAPC